MLENYNKKSIFVYNPNSGNGIFRNSIDSIIERFQKVNIQIIPIRATTEKVFEEFISTFEGRDYWNEYDRILVAGGDGTLNICINAMRKFDIKLPIGLFPVGTANDVANNMGIDAKTMDISDYLDIASGSKTALCDLGRVNDKYFISELSIGAIAEISQNTSKLFKHTMGVFSYYYTAFTKVPRMKTFHIKMEIDGKLFEDDIYCLIVMNCKSSRGIKSIAPSAKPNDGKFEVIIFKNMAAFKKNIAILKLLNLKNQHSKYVLRESGKSIHIKIDDGVPVDIDGESFESNEMDIRIIQSGVEFFVQEDSNV